MRCFRLAFLPYVLLAVEAQQHPCAILGQTWLAKCDTSKESTAGTSCPAGCMDAYEAFAANTACKNGNWTENVTRAQGGYYADTFMKAFGRTKFGFKGAGNGRGRGKGDSSGPGGGNKKGWWPNSTTVSFKPYILWGTLVHRLADRCEWPDLYGTCAWHYDIALETAEQPPGEVLNYNCSALKDRNTCSAECKSILKKTETYCKQGHEYTSRAGLKVDYKGMMGSLHVQQACHDFKCTSSSLGEAFCSSLHHLSQSSADMYSTIKLGCDLKLSLAAGLLYPKSGNPLIALPYRAKQCLSNLAAGEDKDVKLRDICYCTGDKCPNDKRELGKKCTNGVFVPSPTPPSVGERG